MKQAAVVTEESATDLYNQGVADADQQLQCKQLLEHVKQSLANSTEKPRLPLLSSTVRNWLGEYALSLLMKMSVAERRDKVIKMVGIFEEGETRRGKHSSFSRWLNKGTPWPFSPNTALRLVWCCIQQRFWQPEMRQDRPLLRHEYYSQLLEQLDSNATTRNNLSVEAPGIYQCFRPSIAFPGRFVFGLFAIALMEDGPLFTKDATRHHERADTPLHVLRTVELHRMAHSQPPVPGIPVYTEHSMHLAQSPNVEEIFRGYVVKKGRQMLIHAFDSVTCSFQYSVVTNFLLSEPVILKEPYPTHAPRRESARIQMMSGIAVGLVGQLGFYSVPTVLLRVRGESDERVYKNDEEVIEMLRRAPGHGLLGMLTEDQLPEFVKQQFQVIERQVFLHPA